MAERGDLLRGLSHWRHAGIDLARRDTHYNRHRTVVAADAWTRDTETPAHGSRDDLNRTGVDCSSARFQPGPHDDRPAARPARHLLAPPCPVRPVGQPARRGCPGV